MDYKIISADAEHGRIKVTYINDGTDLATFDIDVPIANGSFVTGDALVKLIQDRKPLWLLERKNLVADTTGFDAISALVQKPNSNTISNLANNDILQYVPISNSTTANVLPTITLL
jgi:hypothetical protein